MNSMERVQSALNFKEPDRVPLMLTLTIQGAKYAGVSIKSYFSDPALVARTQIAMQKQYRSDCYFPFYYASRETEAFGGKTIFYDQAPPNAGEPFISTPQDIDKLQIPDPKSFKPLQAVLETIRLLKRKTGNSIAIIGVVVSPFSLPIMQMGFGPYVELLYQNKVAFWQLMRKNIEFTVKWGNAQAAVGADTICYFDPMSSQTIIPPALFLQTGFEIAKSTIGRFTAPAGLHPGSGRSEALADHIQQTGAKIMGVSEMDNLSQIKQKTYGKVSLLGNISGTKLINWSEEELHQQISKLKPHFKGGGFLLSDHHGEIPYQVSHANLLALARVVADIGRY